MFGSSLPRPAHRVLVILAAMICSSQVVGELAAMKKPVYDPVSSRKMLSTTASARWHSDSDATKSRPPSERMSDRFDESMPTRSEPKSAIPGSSTPSVFGFQGYLLGRSSKLETTHPLRFSCTDTGQNLEFWGQPGRTYAMVIDDGFQINARFENSWITKSAHIINQHAWMQDPNAHPIADSEERVDSGEQGASTMQAVLPQLQKSNSTWITQIGIVIDDTRLALTVDPRMFHDPELDSDDSDDYRAETKSNGISEWDIISLSRNLEASLQCEMPLLTDGAAQEEIFLQLCFYGGKILLDNVPVNKIGKYDLGKGGVLVLKNGKGFGRAEFVHEKLSVTIDYIKPPDFWILPRSEWGEYAHFNLYIARVALSSAAWGVLGHSLAQSQIIPSTGGMAFGHRAQEPSSTEEFENIVISNPEEYEVITEPLTG